MQNNQNRQICTPGAQVWILNGCFLRLGEAAYWYDIMCIRVIWRVRRTTLFKSSGVITQPIATMMKASNDVRITLLAILRSCKSKRIESQGEPDCNAVSAMMAIDLYHGAAILNFPLDINVTKPRLEELNSLVPFYQKWGLHSSLQFNTRNMTKM